MRRQSSDIGGIILYRYETHLHTSPVSRCAVATVADTLAFYKRKGYDGVFITNHFLDGNINVDRSLPYNEKIEFYFSDYERGVEVGRELGLRVFPGVESSYGGTDFLIYGLGKEWYLANPQIMDMDKRSQLKFIRASGGFVVQAHPFREASYIDHIRLYPDCVDGVEVMNACRTELENRMARLYAENCGFIMTAGSDNHCGKVQKLLSGMEFETPLSDEHDYVARLKRGEGRIFTETNEG